MVPDTQEPLVFVIQPCCVPGTMEDRDGEVAQEGR